MGLFLQIKGLHEISIEDLPTTEIIEPLKAWVSFAFYLLLLQKRIKML